jgi:hypothetical protein
MLHVLSIMFYLLGCVLAFGRVVKLSNNFKYVKVKWHIILSYSIISWIGLFLVLKKEIIPLPNELKGKQPMFQFSLMQRFSNGERINDEY